MSNQEYTFDTFLEDDSNRMAVAAAHAVSKNPGTNCNPLWLYGPSGCGKTHLLKAICHAAEAEHTGLSTMYITAEALINSWIAFRYADDKGWLDIENADVLAVDNVDYFLGKSTMQEELVHLSLRKQNEEKQILLATACPPKDLETLNRRLLDRMYAALLVDMQLPGQKLKRSFATSLLQKAPFDITKDTLEYMADTLASIPHIRESMRVACLWSRTYGAPIDIEWMKAHISQF